MIVPKILADRTYDIEFQGYLSNHAKHAIVALERINAPEERIQEWWDGYTKETPYGFNLHEVDQEWGSVKPCTLEEWKAWKGKKIHWQEMCMFMQKELSERFEGDTKRLITEYAPPLFPGMTGGLTHGIIHLGWAVDADSEWMIIEGLAYLNFCNLGVDPSKITVDDKDEAPMETFLRTADLIENDNLGETWIASTKSKYGTDFHSELVPAGFQWELAKVLEEPHAVATSTPKWLVDTPLPDLWEALYRNVVLVYLATKSDEGNGNFLILHGISSLWGLEHVLAVIDDEKVTRSALQQYYVMLICLLSASSEGFPSSAVLTKAASEYDSSSTESPEWKPIEVRGIAEEEEHNIKLVYVCRELWKRYDHWSGFCEAARSFTLTPNIGPRATAFKA